MPVRKRKVNILEPLLPFISLILAISLYATLQVNTENNGIIEFTIIEGTFIDGVRFAEGVKVKVESEVYSYAEGMRYTPLEWKR